jgi:hypothetical protein
MSVYFVWFFFLGVMACTQERAYLQSMSKRIVWRPAQLLAFFLLTIFIGFRHEVGGDWSTYLEHIELLRGVDLLSFWEYGDPAYALLNWIGSNLFGDVYFVNVVCALLFCWGLFAFARFQPRPWLVLMIAFPYLILVVAMGYTRQGVAISLLMLGLVSLMKRSLFQFVIWIAFAALFHKTVLVFLPMAVFSVSQRPAMAATGILITASLSFYMLIQEALEGFVSLYIDDAYESAGAGLRIGLNVIPAVIFLLFSNRFGLERYVHRFWTWVSVTALMFVILLYVSPSTAAVDRLALYWIPLQLFVLSRLPEVLGANGQRNSPWVILLAVYSGFALWSWLFFAHHSSFWIPYRFYPLVMFP